MIQKEFIEFLSKQLSDNVEKNFANGITILKKNTENAAGAAGGRNNPQEFPGYEIKYNERKFILRPVNEINSKRTDIVIEHFDRDRNDILINFALNGNTFFFNENLNSISLIENYRVTIGRPVSVELFKGLMRVVGMDKDVILEESVENFNLESFLKKLFEWALKREQAKSNYRLNKEVIIDKNSKTSNSEIMIESTVKNNSLNQILYGPPGTGKTYKTAEMALNILGSITAAMDRHKIMSEYQSYVDDGRIVFTTFHQSMSYEDFIEGIKPVINTAGEVNTDSEANSNNEIEYEITTGIFKRLAGDARELDVKKIDVNWDQVKFYKMSLGGRNKPDIHEWCINNNKIAFRVWR